MTGRCAFVTAHTIGNKIRKRVKLDSHEAFNFNSSFIYTKIRGIEKLKIYN